MKGGYTILILTHVDKNTGDVLLPHLKWIGKTNPEIDTRIIVGEDSPLGKKYNWKNGDQPLRKWWKEHCHTIKTDNVAVVEWDTLIGCKLPDIPEEFDLVGGLVMRENPSLRGKWKPKLMGDPTWSEDCWYWWGDIPMLQIKSDERAIGLVSFGALFMRKWVLDVVCDERWDQAYLSSIQNELRFPTIASVEGARVGTIELPFVSWTNVSVGDIPGIYHSVKHDIPLNIFKYCE
jgi:hypothetical protein